MLHETSLRERKAAQTRIALTLAFRDALSTTSFSDIRIEDLVAQVGVSKVTFFNYFASKEAAIDYVLVVWLYELQAEILRREAYGIAVVLVIAEFWARHLCDFEGSILQVFSFHIAGNAYRESPELTLAERQAIAPDLKNHELQSRRLGDVMTSVVRQARELGQIEIEDDFEFAHYLGSLMNGALITGSRLTKEERAEILIKHVRRALRTAATNQGKLELT